MVRCEEKAEVVVVAEEKSAFNHKEMTVNC